ncbi:UDP-3-O-(3-hydroxymyristoyl)glucosamine N-acyltransferase [Desulfosarcina sp. OttesenSCG-928-A07]|nr:UDP-3-O-(3-hydroxymyristoyl)glucosamine N-acyltransferase [Desulfosarcina sp. OttesenSCG-928-A07]
MTGGHSLESLARLTGGTLSGDPGKKITGVAAFDDAAPDQITLAASAAYLNRIKGSCSGALIVPKTADLETPIPLIRVDNPQLAFAQVVLLFHPLPVPEPGISHTARIGNNVRLGENVHVGHFACIGDGSVIGKNTVIHSHAVIGEDVVIGEAGVIFPHVTILHGCRIGNRVTLHPGAVIGADGFGFVPDSGTFHKIPQIGIVQIDDDVNIGANTTIDRATLGRTWIQRGVKIDNLVHVAHNVVIGEDSVIVAQVGIAGSTTIGHHTILAGQAGVSGHLSIGNKVTIGPKSGIAKSVPDGQVVSSALTAMPHRTWLRLQHVMPELPDLKKKIIQLEKELQTLKNRPTDV